MTLQDCLSKSRRRVAASVIVGLCTATVASGCSRAVNSSRAAPATPSGVLASPEAKARADSARLPYTVADIQFMSGMIPHHAQAVKIAGWAASHGARADLRILAERIVVAQRDEIEMMRTWLRDRNQPVPPADATHLRMSMGGMAHDMLMPGMLSDEELALLDQARGTEFDRLFLTFMIRHHEGALAMVNTLFATPGAAQDETVFRFASDVHADQETEIERMQALLASLPAPGGR